MSTKTEFETLLTEFNELAKSEKNVTKEITALKEKAKLGIGLNGRQMEAVIQRCDNLLNGNYGNTKRDWKLTESKK